MSHTNMVLGSWGRDEWPEYVTVSHDGMREPGRRYVPERTCTIDYDAVHLDYVCSRCGERYEYDMYAAVNYDDGTVFMTMRYCPNCGSRVVDE